MQLRTFNLTIPIFSNISNFTASNEIDMLPYKGPYQVMEIVIIVLFTGFLSFVTITGNILVMLAIIINRSLQTINNYFLFSLACADLVVGISSMNLFTVYTAFGYWLLGPVLCYLWLSLDFVVCTASVFHLIVISFDRYFCIAKPLSYPAWRTTRIAGKMIAAAWVIPLLLWPLPIIFGPFVVLEGILPECYIDYLSNPSMSFISSTALLYLPVTIMSLLYWQISRASKSRVKMDEYKQKKGKRFNSEAGTHISIPCDDNYDATQCVERNQNGETFGVGGEGPSAPVHPERKEIMEAPALYKGNPTAHRHTVTSKQQPTKKAPPSREKKVTRMISMILVAFVITWTPYQVMKVVNNYCSTCITSWMKNFGFWICYCNSTINPACYAFCNASFKRTFKQLLLCQHKDIRLGR